MGFRKITLMTFKLFIVFTLINLLWACSGVNPLSPGAWVEEKNRISLLAAGPQEGSWETRDLTIEYELVQQDDALQISGVVNFGVFGNLHSCAGAEWYCSTDKSGQNLRFSPADLDDGEVVLRR